MLISEEYLKNRWGNFSFERILSAEFGKIIAQPKESTETTHISIIDKFGNAVCLRQLL